MKTKALTAALVLIAFTSGCATRTTTSGGKETTILAGAVTVSTGSFQPTPPATIDADTSKIIGKNGPSGNKTSLLWGLITLHDY
jgi:outer membrane lipoprotein SlyB